jgi:uncharacterized membrane protein
MEYPMSLGKRSNFVLARSVSAGVWGVLCALILAPPVLVSAGCHSVAAVIHLFFSPFCHQIPERSFALLGVSLAVCHRCFGIYLGLCLGSLIHNPWMHRSNAVRRRWVLVSTVPLVLDALLPYTGLWHNTGVSRFATGLCFGIPVASLLVRGVGEFLNEAPWRRFTFGDSSLRESSYERR